MYVLHFSISHRLNLEAHNNAILGNLQKRQAHVLYICALVVLWMSITSSSISYWFYTRIQFVVDNSSSASILKAIHETSNLIFFVPDLVTGVVSQSILVTAILLYAYRIFDAISYRFGAAMFYGIPLGAWLSLSYCFLFHLVCCFVMPQHFQRFKCCFRIQCLLELHRKNIWRISTLCRIESTFLCHGNCCCNRDDCVENHHCHSKVSCTLFLCQGYWDFDSVSGARILYSGSEFSCMHCSV